MHRGYIKLYRKIEDNPLSHDPQFMATWVWILMLANHSNKEWKVGYDTQPIKRGEFITSRANLAKITGVNESKVERILKWLENEQQIEQVTTSKYRLIIVKNYEQYQSNEQQVNSKRTASEQQVNTTKECNNDKNVIVELSKIFNYQPKYNQTSYKAIEKLIKKFKTEESLLRFANKVASIEEYPYVIESPNSLYMKSDRIIARLKSNKPKMTYEGQPVRQISGKYQIQGADGQWREFGGDINKIIKNI